MRNTILFIVIGLMILGNGILFYFAFNKKSSPKATNIVKTPKTKPVTATSETSQPSTLEPCFRYYDYGKVSVQLSAEKNDYNTGDPITLHGQIINNNTFPLRDLILFAHIRRKNEETYQQNGHFLIDKLPLLQDFNLQAKETKEVEVTVPFNKTYPTGDYRIQYYILSKDGFHYGGRSFLEEDFAGATDIRLNSATDPLVYFDIDNLVVNQSPHAIRENIFEYPAGPITFDISIIDNRSEQIPLPIKVKIYSFEDDVEGRLISESTMDIQNKQLEYMFTPPKTGAYILQAEIDSPSKSIFKYRFASAAEGISELRMNDIGIQQFPINDKTRAWVCFHAAGRTKTEKTSIQLALLNNAGKTEQQTELIDSIDGDVHAISLPIGSVSTPENFWIQATFANADTKEVNKTIKKQYSCDMFKETLKSITLSYSQTNPENIKIIAYNACNKKINQKLFINSFTLTQNKKIIREETNKLLSNGIITIGELAPGTYKASVTVQQFNKSILIIVPQPSLWLTLKSYALWIIAGIGIVCIIVISIFVMKKKT